MSVRRAAAAGLSIAITGAAATLGAAGADAASGVGTAASKTRLLSVQLGEAGALLDVGILADAARATNDPRVAAGEATSILQPLSIASAVVPALDRDVASTQTRAPGGPGSATTPGLDISKPAPGVSIPAIVARGAIAPATLESKVEGASASSKLSAQLTSLGLAGELVSAQAVRSKLGAATDAASASTDRVVAAEAVTLLDLSALLQGLGLTLAELPVEAVTGLLGELGISVGGLSGDALQAQIDGIQAELDSLASTGGGVSTGTVLTIVDGVGLADTVDTGAITSISDPVDRANALVDELQAALAGILERSVTALDAAPLVRAEGVEIAVRSKANGIAADSIADVTAKIGSIRVGTTTIPGIDLAAAADQVAATAAAVDAAVAGVLGQVAPSLAGVVDVELFAKERSTSVQDGYTKAASGITVLTAKVTPPAELAAIIDGIAAATDDVAKAITDAGGSLPVVGTEMTALGSRLGTGVRALGSGATVRLGEVSGSSEFALAAAPPAGTPGAPGTPRARTGGGTGVALALGGVLLAGALGAARIARSASPAGSAVGREL